MSDAYLRLGVSATKTEVHQAISQLPPSLFPGSFCHLVEDFYDPTVVQAMHSDGAGTKANVAYIAYRSTGDAKWFRTLAQDSVVMNLDDLICIGAVDDFLLTNTIGRNAKLIPGAVLEHIVEGYRDFSHKMAGLGVKIQLAGGETADSGDTVRTIVVDSTVYVRLQRQHVIDFSRVVAGDVIVGLESTGRATYEDQANSGVGSNGLTLARHALLSTKYAREFPETYSPELDMNNVYRGNLHVEDMLPGTEMTVAAALLSPTRSYAPIVRRILLSDRNAVHGLIHNTGGGLTKCLKFGRRLRFVKHSLFPLPPVFEAIQERGGLAEGDMLQTFNCGHRLEIFCPPEETDRIIGTAAEFGVAGKVIGEVLESKSDRNQVEIHSRGKVYCFD